MKEGISLEKRVIRILSIYLAGIFLRLVRLSCCYEKPKNPVFPLSNPLLVVDESIDERKLGPLTPF